MFLEQEQKKDQAGLGQAYTNDPPRLKNNKVLMAVVVFLAVVIFGIFLVVYTKSTVSKQKVAVPQNIQPVATSSVKQGNLPGEYSNKNGSDQFGTSTENLKAEDISFGFFYKKIKNDFQPSFKAYELPVNIKIDANNYYDVSRKINLDKYVAELDKNGYAIFENNVDPASHDFISLYRYLLSKQIPIMITNDFLTYYYQNTFKKVYKEVEKNVFYENVWDINNKLLTIALTRYKKRLSETGNTNDPVLEAQRLELAYFAVALKLLSPTTDQINIKNDLNENTKFNTEEAEKYDYAVPEYLKDDVEKEVQLIRTAKDSVKSPVFLYNQDYSIYQVPANYKSNVKLNNFYLVLKWFNSPFPVYFKSAGCPDCLLDKEDWIINMSAANFIAKDLADNQDLKNRWAIIYKFISFFSGLRQDLTYLHYNQTMKELFGQDYSIEDIFSSQNKDREYDLVNIQNKLASYNFSELEGMIDRSNPKNQPFIGMRMLQQAYWPNDYIFKQLSGTDLKSFKQVIDPKKVLTVCKTGDKENFAYRCTGFGMDIINILHPVENGGQYFTANTDYDNYQRQIDFLTGQIAKFDNYSWNNNIYWLDLDLSRTILNKDIAQSPVFMRGDNWLKAKDYNTILGGWVNLHLPEDELVNFNEQTSNGLGMSTDCSSFNYIEPNIALIQEMMARNEMLVNMLTMLRVAEKTNAVSIELKDLNQNLERALNIIKKELTDTNLSGDDCTFIKDFATHYEISHESAKTFTLDFKDKKVSESIKGIKIMVIVNQFGDKKALVVGPLFNYSEN